MFREGLRPPDPFAPKDPFAAETQDGVSLRALSMMGGGGGRLLLVFPGDDKWLAPLAAQRDEIERGGARIAIVHRRELDFKRDGLTYVARVLDGDGALHEHFELGETKRLLGKPKQLPGAFLLVDCEIQSELRPRALGNRPDLIGLSFS